MVSHYLHLSPSDRRDQDAPDRLFYDDETLYGRLTFVELGEF